MGADDQLVVGVSTRAMAESAYRAGAVISAVDFFGDRDQAALFPCQSLGEDMGLPLSSRGLFEAVKRLAPKSFLYTSGLDNHPDLVASLAQNAKVLGNTAQALDRAKDWLFLRKTCAELDIPCPPTILPGEKKGNGSGLWLRKPARGGGGRGVGFWSGGKLLPGTVAQAFVPGVPASCAMLADGENCQVLGLTEQLVGLEAFGVDGFRWCGNIFPLEAESGALSNLMQQMQDMASRFTRGLKLKGICGLDLIVTRRGEGLTAHLIEVNPRPTASLELLEGALGLNMYSAHLAACEGSLPLMDLGMPSVFWGKAVVFAGRDLVLPCTDDWQQKGRKDIPDSGRLVKAHSPVCTVFAKGQTRESCLNGLKKSADSLRQEIKDDNST